MKNLFFFDCMGLCVHDSTLYNHTFDSSLIQPGNYCKGNGGFTGCIRCICNYPKNCSNISRNVKTFVSKRYENFWISVDSRTFSWKDSMVL